MRLHSKGTGMKRRLRAWTRTIVVGLAALLMLSVAGCADAEPDATGEPAVSTSAQVATPTPSVTAPPSPAPAVATAVEVVYASPAYPLPWDQGEYDPLWGDLDADAPIIDRLLRAIAGATPVEIVEVNDDRIWTWYSSFVINLRFRNSTTWSVRTAIRCDLTSEGRETHCLPVPDHWELLHRNEVVVSTALTEWFQQVREYMPSVEQYALPDQIRLGEPFVISGAGYHEGDRVELSIEFIDQSKLPLGEAPVAGIKDRATNKVKTEVVESTNKATLQGFVVKNTEDNATVYTDEWASYKGIPRHHEAVAHGAGEYVRGMAHTNGMESHWATFKRGIDGVYHHISVKHLGRYANEFEGRHNVRPMDTVDQLAAMVRGAEGKRLRYDSLIGDRV